jgi:ABC-type microcin C transport system duplicated ATPase subunit YejF
MGLLSPSGSKVQGEIVFDGKDLLTWGRGELREIRGNRISMIFQEPMTSLNPIHTCGRQVASRFCCTEELRKRAEEKALQAGSFAEYPTQVKG